MTQSASNSVSINQSLVGSIAAAMLIGAGILWYFAGAQNMWTGACLKVGLVMLAVWVALPSISRHGSWGRTSWGTIFGTMVVALILTGKRVDLRFIIPILVGVVLATKFLRAPR